jgi:hypothetical protein
MHKKMLTAILKEDTVLNDLLQNAHAARRFDIKHLTTIRVDLYKQ